jgi:translation initiation factor 3 subunit E
MGGDGTRAHGWCVMGVTRVRGDEILTGVACAWFEREQIAARVEAHLVLPLLEFAGAKGTYDAKDVLKAKLDVLNKTNMCDFAADVHKEVNGGEPTVEMKAKRAAAIEAHGTLSAAAAKAVKFASDVVAVNQLSRDKTFNVKFAKENHGIEAEDVEALFKFAKFQYECGDYVAAAAHLGVVQLLSTDAARCESALWGKYAADILTRNWQGALDDMNRLRDAIESNTSTSALAKMKQRAWLLHASLFVFFNHLNGRNLIMDVMFQEKYMQAVQQEAPYLMRYLAVAVVTNKKRKSMLKDLVKIIQSDTYRDPVLDFVLALFVEFDFSKAQDSLKACDALLDGDFFLVGCKSAFLESARSYVIESYCKVNKRVSIAGLAERLGMSAEEVESWIANLIRANKLNAKIDSEAGYVLMHTDVKSVNEQIIEKTKALMSKTKSLTQAVLANTQAQAY